MIPIPDLRALNYIWPDLRARKFPLHCLLLFAHADHCFPEYLSDSGMADLEAWAAPNCLILLLQAPSSRWIDYAKRNKILWWQLFGSTSTTLGASAADSIEAKTPRHVAAAQQVVVSFSSERTTSRWREGQEEKKEQQSKPPRITEFEAVKNEPILVIDGATYTVEEVFAPCKDQYLQMHELQAFLYRFNRSSTDHPCMIFFKDYRDCRGWFIGLEDLLDQPKSKLRSSLREWFSSAPFLGLVTEAKRA